MDTTHRMGNSLTIGLIGAGRVGSSLALGLQQAGYTLSVVASRTPAHAADLATRLEAGHVALLAAARTADLVFLAVPDDALAPLVQLVADARGWRRGQMVVHLSGVLPAAVLAPASVAGALVGSFHPLAAFAQRNMALPKGMTFAVEAEGRLHAFLHQLAVELGGRALDLAPTDKPLYHAAAVLASNYTVVLAALAAQLLEQVGATGEEALQALLPLLATTLDNLKTEGLPAALTGPIVRGDVGTVTRHLAALDELQPQIADVYRCLGLAALPLTAAHHAPAGLAQLAAALEAPVVHKEHL